MRTLVISDLHLGNRAAHDVLRLPRPRSKLLDALDGVDRLVLLGDTLELMSRHPRRSMSIAEPILRAIGARLGPERELVFVPGNHDGALIRHWISAQATDLRAEATVDPGASPALRRVLSWLAPARTTVSYPGVWLEDRVWATHGHYLDRHLIPQSAVGVLRPALSRHSGRPVAPSDYERARRRGQRSREPLVSRALSRPLATLLEYAAHLLRLATRPDLSVMMRSARLAPLTAGLIDLQMRHASLPAAAIVAEHLGIDADWMIFGHVHRRGPIADEHWPARASGMRLLNTGSWLHEPVLVDRASPPHPYWPGGAVLLETGRPPRSLGLLDGLEARELRASGLRNA